jgi:hypothetical protein
MAYTNIDDPSAHCQSVRWTGNASGSTRDLTFDGNSDLQPDMAIAIAEDHVQSHFITDSSRDWDVGNKELIWDSNNYEGNTGSINSGAYGWVGDGLTDGIQSNQGTAGNGYWNANNEPYYAACWKANGGSVTTVGESGANPGFTRQTNTDAGFSIIAYTGTGSNGTIAHGLPATPTFIYFKRRDSANVGCIWHQGIGDDYKLVTSTYAAKDADGAFMNSTLPTSTNITVGGASVNTNADGGTYICYAWTDIQGFSKFGSYKGNGSSDGNGTFVYTGFKPAFIMTKRRDAVGSWLWHDAKWGQIVSTGNASGNDSNPLTTSMVMESNSNFVDDYGSMDILSNGFKLRSDAAATNAGTAPYVYMAWAENPFVTSTGVPTTAR